MTAIVPEMKAGSAIVEGVTLLCQVCMEFQSNSSDCIARVGVNMAAQTSEMELYIILVALENVECWNQTLVVLKCHCLKQSWFSVLRQWEFLPLTK